MRLLIVEDEVKLSRALARGLEEQGYVVDVAHDGKTGLAKATEEPFDLIILDVMLPGLGGMQLTRRLRALQRDVAILMLTAKDAVEDRIAGLDAGADDYLVKPFAFSELVARVRALLRRGSASREALLRVGDIELDTLAHEVRRDGQPISLTSKEFALLEYFMRNPHRALTRTQIADQVWGYDFFSSSNVVDVYVGSLRKKLNDNGPDQRLRTVRGVGYALRDD